MAILTQASPNKNWKPPEVKILGDRAVQFSDVCVHEFVVSDVDDPDLYAAEPILKWQHSEAGQWVMSHAVETPYWMRDTRHDTWEMRFRIMARLSEQNQTFWRLKWSK